MLITSGPWPDKSAMSRSYDFPHIADTDMCTSGALARPGQSWTALTLGTFCARTITYTPVVGSCRHPVSDVSASNRYTRDSAGAPQRRYMGLWPLPCSERYVLHAHTVLVILHMSPDPFTYDLLQFCATEGGAASVALRLLRPGLVDLVLSPMNPRASTA